MQKITLILPIFNGEKYISRCIDSVLNQTYKNFELIIINDGSTDKSLNIIKKYAKKDNRIKIINKKNEGVSIARNIGIENSTGDFITFIDADDYLETDALETMINLASKYKVEIVRTSYVLEANNKFVYEKKLNYSGKITLNKNYRDIFINDILNQNFGSYLWLLLIKKDFIIKNKIFFEKELYVFQDLDYYINLFKHLTNIYFSNKVTYHYYKNELGSKNYKNTERNILSNINLANKLKEKLSNKYEKEINSLAVVMILPALYYSYKNDKEMTKTIYYNLLDNVMFMNLINNLPETLNKRLIINIVGIKLIKNYSKFSTFKVLYFSSFRFFEILKIIKNKILKKH